MIFKEMSLILKGRQILVNNKHTDAYIHMHTNMHTDFRKNT